MRIIHTMPLLIRSEPLNIIEDMMMASACFESLALSEDALVIIYNQGGLSNDQLKQMCTTFKLTAVILGEGENVGIARARQRCFEYIWEHYCDTSYVSEIHVDMVFTPNWHTPLIDYLENSDEPMISPGIITITGELQPLGQYTTIPSTYRELITHLESLSVDEVHLGFVHPVIHRANALQSVGGYDTQFLSGKQGYEDDSLLIGYVYYMGTKNNWRPKCYLKSWVYHATLAQRMSLPDRHIDFAINEKGLFQQYGAYGLKQLSEIHSNSADFEQLIHRYILEEE
ncbi:glycosyltransferase family protein [Paenibacillus macquariensis]|uniref:Glycosyltransferase, GT2 family n=1 Tax=Paenibacillus macquariensis TaxID=948756 RepID=A0ABY1KBI8_9BACL|nr:hypothetical protein [Paenibacillus macquariensis]MEC0094296.1 hypothetical protein [Paenibacillus macquariensis]OAB25912.1 hypothetical protein PMSM_27610 [Paenibacillus macquariensis subsp. macquariensis]SIR55818.1 hypothetical protein SAMN05421578_118102 [Paenibacillus macquariensis]